MSLIDFFFIHINAFLRKVVNKWLSHANIYSDQRESSVFVN